MIYDVEKLKEEVTPKAVAAYLGLKMVRSGKNTFIECPEHAQRTGKADQRIGNCVLGKTWKNAYYCFACGAAGSIPKLIAYTEGLDLKTQYKDILKIAAEAGGDASGYEIEETKWTKSPQKFVPTSYPILTDEKFKLIGLSKMMNLNELKDAFSPSDINPDDSDLLERHSVFILKDEKITKYEEYIESEYRSYPISKLCQSDPELYRDIVIRACNSSMEKCQKLLNGDIERINRTGNLGLTKSDIVLIKNNLKQKLISIAEVYMEFTGEDILSKVI